MGVHRLVVSHILLKIKRVLLVDGWGKWRIGLLRTLPGRPFIVQVTGAALFDEFKFLSGFSQGLTRGFLLGLFIGLPGLPVDLTIVAAGSMA